MRNYNVYFELYDKKMKATILAKDEPEAKEKLKDKIKFHKVEIAKEPFNDCMDVFDKINDIFK